MDWAATQSNLGNALWLRIDAGEAVERPLDRDDAREGAVQDAGQVGTERFHQRRNDGAVSRIWIQPLTVMAPSQKGRSIRTSIITSLFLEAHSGPYRAKRYLTLA